MNVLFTFFVFKNKGFIWCFRDQILMTAEKILTHKLVVLLSNVYINKMTISICDLFYVKDKKNTFIYIFFN